MLIQNRDNESALSHSPEQSRQVQRVYYPAPR